MMKPTNGELRKAMDSELKALVLPVLRKHFFKGSIPHFRRLRGDGIDLLTVQFDRYGGGFVIEVARCPVEGITTAWGKRIPASKVCAWDVNDRQRIQPRQGSGRDCWFRFDNGDVKGAALSLLGYLPMAEGWWQSRTDQEHGVREALSFRID
jgi:hypothetical protein